MALFCVLLSSGISSRAVVYKIYEVDPRKSLRLVPYNEATKAAIDLQVTQSKDLFETALVALGAIWVLIVAKPDEARITLGDRPELLMFGCTSILLLLSLLWHDFYMDELRYYMWLGATACFSATEKCIPDVSDAPLNFLYSFQGAFLWAGALQAVLTLFSAHRIKERI